MDCETFDLHVIDALYEELDEDTWASLKRHMETCSRCAETFASLRATREAAILPMEEPSEGLTSRILFAANAAQKRAPWHKKALRGLAWAGSHVMRPQFAMAAVFALVIGSSLLLLRAKPGSSVMVPVRVVEEGQPAPEARDEGGRGAKPRDQSLDAPSAGAEAPIAAATAEAAFGAKESRGDARGRVDAQEEEQKNEKGNAAAARALREARSAEQAGGCSAALSMYDSVGSRFAGTPEAAAAMWSAAECHRKGGQDDKARELYGLLSKRDEYAERAKGALDDMDANVGNNAQAARPGGGSSGPAAPAKAAAAPATATTKPPTGASTKNAAPVMEVDQGSLPGGGSGSRVYAAPKQKQPYSDAVK